MDLERYTAPVLRSIEALSLPNGELNGLYEPFSYSMEAGGKRIRPAAVLMGTEYFGGDLNPGLNAALGIEIFHNFTLVHDDVMDDAPTRRGRPTVFKKWDLNTAVLSGDIMMIYAYEYIMKGLDDGLAVKVFKCFNQTAKEVCDGQQLDMDFETRTDVTIANYEEMITLKTAVLLGASFKIGALIGGASDENAGYFYQFGKSLGVAFQLQDDILDAYGDPETFGKQVGGDILANKKTYLLLTAMARANEEQLTRLKDLMDGNSPEKVTQTLALFDELQVKELAIQKMNEHYELAIVALNTLEGSEKKKAGLRSLAEFLMGRVN